VSLVLQNEKAQEMHFESMERALSKLYAIFTNLSGYAGPTLKRKVNRRGKRKRKGGRGGKRKWNLCRE